MIVREIVDDAGFEALASGWDTFLARSAEPTPFNTFEWLSAWWRTMRRGRALLVVVVESPEEGIVAVAPMAIGRRRGLRILEFVGTGLTDYPDFIVAKGWESAVDDILGHLARSPRRWDVADLRLRELSADRLALSSVAARHGLRYDSRVYELAPYTTIEGTWDAFVAGGSKKFRYAVREREKRFLAVPGAAMQRLDADDIDARVVDAVWQVEQSSWKMRAGTSVLIAPDVRRFYAEFFAAFARRGWLTVRLAEIDNTPVAYVITLHYGGRTLLYALAFDSRHAAIAPGMALLQGSIRDAFAARSIEYDFLCGSEPYKDRWASNRRHVLQIVLTPRGVRPAVARLAYRARWRLARSRRLKSVKIKLAGVLGRLRSTSGLE